MDEDKAVGEAVYIVTGLGGRDQVQDSQLPLCTWNLRTPNLGPCSYFVLYGEVILLWQCRAVNIRESFIERYHLLYGGFQCTALGTISFFYDCMDICPSLRL